MGEEQIAITHGDRIASMHPELTHCKSCDAVYLEGNWYKGYYDEGTRWPFTAICKVPLNKCPICLKTKY
jgi:hypothetical protein